jgi:hypothetical protein
MERRSRRNKRRKIKKEENYNDKEKTVEEYKTRKIDNLEEKETRRNLCRKDCKETCI